MLPPWSRSNSSWCSAPLQPQCRQDSPRGSAAPPTSAPSITAATSSCPSAALAGPSSAIAAPDAYRSTPWTERLRGRPLPPPIARRDRKLQHLRNRVAMNVKPLCGLPAAQPIHHHRTSYPGIEFHCEHPSSPPCQSKASRRHNRTGTLLRRHQKAIKAGSVVHFVTAVYSSRCIRYLRPPIKT